VKGAESQGYVKNILLTLSTFAILCLFVLSGCGGEGGKKRVYIEHFSAREGRQESISAQLISHEKEAFRELGLFL
jgi:hypothetical protein